MDYSSNICDAIMPFYKSKTPKLLAFHFNVVKSRFAYNLQQLIACAV